jgi:tyrosyl-tRNA synthetase
VRRVLARESFGLTLPLITRADGSKFGKTAAGAVWLDPRKTSPFSFYQFWLNTADADAVKYLKIFTFLDLAAIDGLAQEAALAPQERATQRRLAREVTGMVHGAQALASAERITECLFAGDVHVLSEDDLDQLEQDGMDTTLISEDTAGLLSALVDSGLAPSRGAARKLVQSSGIRVNGLVQTDVEREFDWRDALYGRFYLLRKGKKNWHMLVRKSA